MRAKTLGNLRLPYSWYIVRLACRHVLVLVTTSFEEFCQSEEGMETEFAVMYCVSRLLCYSI